MRILTRHAKPLGSLISTDHGGGIGAGHQLQRQAAGQEIRVSIDRSRNDEHPTDRGSEP